MNSSNKYLCIHGHFYQPPRENAWLEVVGMQDSAAPFHDWNERINFECYAPNTAARILDDQGFIIKIINNYTRISFNMGPTLLSWLEAKDPDTYQSILEADKLSQKRFNGHGSAIAQVHSHIIMPLANKRDKETQIAWGIADFEHRFKRKPEGIWLAETAVDTETLEMLVQQGIKYTILAPRQARNYRKIGKDEWTSLRHIGVNPRRPYKYNLPSGKSIALFFYDGEVAQDVAFKGLLNSGKAFANRLVSAFSDEDASQLAHIATDGESYGHHHRYGEMALADCLNYIEEKGLATLTNYGEYLEKFPPEYEIEIHENSSWSCVHGVERWRSNCGCNTGGQPGWTQEWRAPLRAALDWLREELIKVYEVEARRLVKEPWVARNEYIQVLLHREEDFIQQFIEKHALRPLDTQEKTRLLRLLETQRHAMLMYTSCGWFFSEISGIETDQILQYANRAMYFVRQVTGLDLNEVFTAKLEASPSNVYENGAVQYRKNVMPAAGNLDRLAMHYAASSLFEAYPDYLEIFNYIATSEQFERIKAGGQRLAVGRTRVKSRITHSEKLFSFAVLHLGQQNIIGHISIDMSEAIFEEMHEKIIEAFKGTNLGNVIGLMQDYFGKERFTIWHLFTDEKRKILEDTFNRSIPKLETAVRDFYEDNYQLMVGMRKSNISIPEGWKDTAQFIVNADFHRFFKDGKGRVRELRHLAKEFEIWNIQITNLAALKLTAGEYFFREIAPLQKEEKPSQHLEHLNDIFEILDDLKVGLDVWKSQNLYFSLLKQFQNGTRQFPDLVWKAAFLKLGEWLKVRS